MTATHTGTESVGLHQLTNPGPPDEQRTAEVDAIVEVVCEDDDSLLDLLNTKIRALPGVISTETLVYLKLVKQQYNWGTR